MKSLIKNELIRLQALAADAFHRTITQESTAANASRSNLPIFEPGDIVPFYHHQYGGRIHKLPTN